MKVALKLTRDGRVQFAAAGLGFGPGRPALRLDGRPARLRFAGVTRRGSTQVARWRAGGLELVQVFKTETPRRVRIVTTARNLGTALVAVNDVTLFATSRLDLGRNHPDVRILEQNAYLGRVRTPRQMVTGSDGLKALDGTTGAFVSQNHTLFYDPSRRAGVLLGFEHVDRWLPEFAGRMTAASGRLASGQDNVDGAVRAGSTAKPPVAGPVPGFREFSVRLDAGDYPLAPGEELALGDWMVEAGADPLALLAAHGSRIKARNRFRDPPGPLANWCSWYPYRLGVTQERVLETARAARARGLGRLGLKYLQVDLGWERDNIPTYFETNERFARGLGWLSRGLRREGFDLGLWVGVLCVADTHPIAREHPEWLMRGADGKPFENYRWFWEPFCPVYALDVSHPGAQDWLRQNFTRLAEQGVRYVKWDFAGVVTGEKLRGRHDARMAAPRAREAVRTAFRIGQEALNSTGEPVLMLDCSGTDYAGAGVMALCYTIMDTGNSGIGWRHLREVYTSYACHLFKQRWALLQPSCLVVGLPGTLEEARARATATFMGAGHVDIGDDLTNLPEDRWQVLLATLPPNDTPATPVDLFHPVSTGTLPYLTLIKAKERRPRRDDPGLDLERLREREPAGACIWTVPMRADWDEWTLVAVFNWTESPIEPSSGVTLARRFQVEFTRLGLPRGARLWAYEFWSGQFLGEVPRPLRANDAYRHPGDFTNPIQESAPGVLDLGFHGPAVKLLVLRRPRPHPWPVGTSFHQSGGRELTGVRWHARTRTLSGRLLRPRGESGFLMIAGLPDGGVRRVPVTATADVTFWSIRF